MVTAAVMAQPPFTSDSRDVPRLAIPPYPGRAPIYVPAVPDVYDELVTNQRVLVVEETVYSNVVQRTVWHKKGEHLPRTNYLILSSNKVSQVTNSLAQ